MTDYKGKNKTKSTRIIAAQRAIYKLNAFKKNSDERAKSVKNFNFAERTQYGRINTAFNTVYPNRSELKRLKNPDKESRIYSCQNFVADAFERFVAKMKQAVVFGNCPKDHPYLTEIKVYGAYQDPYGLYNEYMEDLLDSFVDQINEKTILTFDDWTNQFLFFCKRNGAKFPITFSGFQRTDKSNIFTSGLAISISDLKADDDTKKQEFFLDYKAIDFYINTAKQYGFYVDLDRPWVLVADLNSPAMLLYTKKYDLSTVNQIFSENYSLCYEEDIRLLRSALETSYNEFIYVNPYNTDLDTSTCKTKININNKIIINNNINNKYYINIYIQLRNIEEYNILADADIRRLKEKAIFFEKKLDTSRSISYINNQFNQMVLSRPGGMNDLINKQKERRNSDISNN
jgi:hypothetical protein